MPTASAPIKAVLCDIEGTLVSKGTPVPGAAESLERLRASGVRVLLTTNITARTPARIAKDLRNMGFGVEPGDIQTAATACAGFLRSKPDATCVLMVPEAVHEVFADVIENQATPDYIVLGDMGDGFDYVLMNRAFGLLDKGAQLLALHRNMWWFDGPRKRLDAGAFVAGLEAATGRKALVMGKPSAQFFETALRTLGVSADEALIVGDDVATDIAGALGYPGLRSALVGTGKFRPEHASQGGYDWFVDSVAELPDLLESLAG